MDKYFMKKITVLLMTFWLIAAFAMMLMDAISYYELLTEDWFQMINRKMNMNFAYMLFLPPMMFAIIYISNKENKKTFK